MAKRRKLQVFVSSTFTDLKEERQTAVEAILTTGHIPAGMELFAGKNEAQMNIIKEWIEESDIYMLLLGGRYGSVEPVSSKSYTHLEYEHAKSLDKPVFVVVASDDYINQKIFANAGKPDGIIELEHRKEYDNFKKDITGRFVKYWENRDQLQLFIANTLHALERDENLVGWVPGSEATDSKAIIDEMSRLAKDNADLRQKLDSKSTEKVSDAGLDFKELLEYLDRVELDESYFNPVYYRALTIIANDFDEYATKPTVLHFFWLWSNYGIKKVVYNTINPYISNLMETLAEVDLVSEGMEKSDVDIFGRTKDVYTGEYRITETGKRFFVKLKFTFNIKPEKALALITQEKVSIFFMPFK